MPQSEKSTPLSNRQSFDFLSDLQLFYPEYRFKPGLRFLFRPPNTIFYEPLDGPFQPFALQLLHELGHAISGHRNFQLSIDRLKIETEAWQAAEKILQIHPELVAKYHLSFDQEFAEVHLDTYRRWLHQKTTCKKCGLTMFQDKNQTWYCPHCDLF